MNTKKIFAYLLILISMILVISGCNAQKAEPKEEPTQAQKVYEWDFFVVLPVNQARSAPLAEFANAVKEKTNGRLVITPRPAGELPYKGQEILQVVSKNTIEMADATMPYMSGDSQAGAVVTWPFLCGEQGEFVKAVEATRPIFAKELKERGIRLLFWFPDPSQVLWGSGKPIEYLEDFKGRKLRTQNSQMQVFANKVQSSSISMTSPEVPQSMQRGVINTMVTSSVTVNDNKFYEFLDWGNLLPVHGGGAWIVVNEQAFAELPADIQKILLEEAAISEKKMINKVIDDDAKALDNIKKNGVDIYDYKQETLDKGVNIIKDEWTTWAKEAGPYAEEALAAIRKALNK